MPLKLHNEVSAALSLKNKTQGWWCPSVSSWGHSLAPVAAVTLVAQSGTGSSPGDRKSVV